MLSSRPKLQVAQDPATTPDGPRPRRRADPTPVVLERGTAIGRYTILEHVGSGGMASVYSAYDTQLERIVALKTLHAELELDSVRARMSREAQAMARLKHPNVVTVYDVGTVDDRIYIAMEFVDGTTLSKWSKSPRPWRELVKVLKAAGRGLAAAHDAGLVHRDFKPDNVLVGKDGRVLVSDFGLALSREQGGAEGSDANAGDWETGSQRRPQDSAISASDPTPTDEVSGDGHSTQTREVSGETTERLTQEGAILGTTGFIAPEHLLEGIGDARSDVFAFCVTMYKVLYGKRPFESRNLAAYCDALQKPPSPPPDSTSVPRWVHAVVLRGLEVDPARRFASMHELLDALDEDPARRYRAFAGGALLLAGCLAGMFAYGRHRADLRRRCDAGGPLIASTWNEEAARKVRVSLAADRGALGLDRAERVSARLAAYANTWSDTYRNIAEKTLLRREDDARAMERRHRCLERGREQFAALVEILAGSDARIGQHALDAAIALPAPARCATTDLLSIPALPASPELRTRVLPAERALAEAKAHAEAGDNRGAAAIIARALPDVRAIPFPRGEADLLLLDSTCKAMTGDPKAALVAAEAAFGAAQRGSDDGLAARAAAVIANVRSTWLGAAEEGEKWMTVAEAIGERSGRDEATEFMLLNIRVGVNGVLGRPEQNFELHDREIAIARSLYGERDPRVAIALMDRAGTYFQTGRFDRAYEDGRDSVLLFAETAGPDHPKLSMLYANLASFLELLSRLEEAKEAYEHGLDVERGSGTDPGAVTLVLLGGYAGVENRLGHPDAALEIGKRGLEVARLSGTKGWILWTVELEIAKAKGAKGDFAGMAHGSLAIFEAQRAAGVVKPEVPYLPDALTSLGEAELRLRRFDSAIRHLEQSVSLPSRQDQRDLPRARFALAKALRTAGKDAPRAKELAENARDDLRKLPGTTDEVAVIEQWLVQSAGPTSKNVE
jgi:serine/threonine protein kinase/tetratricopeptide (TPR) repeat protein